MAKSNPISFLPHQDRRLVERCLEGDVAAWSEIYNEFHDSLLVTIRKYLNRSGGDSNLVEEIAARVWYALIKNDFGLLCKFDVSRGCRFSTFLAVIAKNEIRVLFRSERRRRAREHLASRPNVSDEIAFDSKHFLENEEFLVTLSQAERTFYLNVLVAQPADREKAEQAYSTKNSWQLRYRIRQKLLQFLSGSDK